VSVRDEGLDEASQWIAKHRAEWAESFGFLDQHLRSKKGQK
jgi:hypothetical protein